MKTIILATLIAFTAFAEDTVIPVELSRPKQVVTVWNDDVRVNQHLQDGYYIISIQSVPVNSWSGRTADVIVVMGRN